MFFTVAWKIFISDVLGRFDLHILASFLQAFHAWVFPVLISWRLLCTQTPRNFESSTTSSKVREEVLIATWQRWKCLNRLRTGVGRSRDAMQKWGFYSDQQLVSAVLNPRQCNTCFSALSLMIYALVRTLPNTQSVLRSVLTNGLV